MQKQEIDIFAHTTSSDIKKQVRLMTYRSLTLAVLAERSDQVSGGT